MEATFAHPQTKNRSTCVIIEIKMYSNPGYGTPFYVKDILSMTPEQQAAIHYGMDFQNLNMNYGNYQYDSPRMGEQLSPMMNAMPGNMGSNSCLYTTNSPPSQQPTYTNLSCSPSVSTMSSTMTHLQVPVKNPASPSTKQDPYENNSAATPGSDTGDLHHAGPPGIDPGARVQPLPPVEKLYADSEEGIDKRKCSILHQVCMLISDDSRDSGA